MSDFEAKLNAILSDPSAMAQIAGIAQSLNLGGSSDADTPAPPSPSTVNPSTSDGGGLGDLSSLGSLLGQIDPAMIQKLLPLVGELTNSSASDERLQLLNALRPFLKPERQNKIEQALKTAKLIHMGKKLFGAIGDDHV